MLLFQTQRDYAFAAAIRWVPSAVSIVVALLVAASTWSRRVAVGTALTLGLVFEVVGSFGIAIAQYADPTALCQCAAVGGSVLGGRLDAGLHGDRPESTAPERSWRR